MRRLLRTLWKGLKPIAAQSAVVALTILMERANRHASLGVEGANGE